MKDEKNTLILATHSGHFHYDEIFAFATLKLALNDKICELVRTRDDNIIEQADIVWDVGNVYNPHSYRFDHHMRESEKPLREEGNPYSSAGLIWKHYGKEAIRNFLFEDSNLDDCLPYLNNIWKIIDSKTVYEIDLIDNGIEKPKFSSVADMIETYNPPWNTPDHLKEEKEQEGFYNCVSIVEDYLKKTILNTFALVQAKHMVLDSYKKSDNPLILELESGMPWQETVYECDLPVLYAVHPTLGGTWMISCMPTEPNGYDQKLSLPEEWAGLRGSELALASGVEDAVFVHSKQFVGGASSKEGAMAMAKRALELGLKLDSNTGHSP